MLLQLRTVSIHRTTTHRHLLWLLVPTYQDLHLTDLLQNRQRGHLPLLRERPHRYLSRPKDPPSVRWGRTGGVFIQEIQRIYRWHREMPIWKLRLRLHSIILPLGQNRRTALPQMLSSTDNGRRTGPQVHCRIRLLPLPHQQVPTLRNTHREDHRLPAYVLSLRPPILLVLPERLLSRTQQRLLCPRTQRMRGNLHQQTSIHRYLHRRHLSHTVGKRCLPTFRGIFFHRNAVPRPHAASWCSNCHQYLPHQ